MWSEEIRSAGGIISFSRKGGRIDKNVDASSLSMNMGPVWQNRIQKM